MDDLVLLRQIGDQTPLPNAGELAGARATVVSAIVAPSPTRRRAARRWGLVGGATVGLAAGIAAVLVLAQGAGVVGTPASAAADPVKILNNAADAALREPDRTPRPDQFLYLKSKEGNRDRESWYSIDGARDGLIKTVDPDHGRSDSTPLPGCRDGRRAVVKGTEPIPGVTERCVPEPAYDADLPTDPAGVLPYLSQHYFKGEPTPSSQIGAIVGAAGNRYLRPAQLAALYRAAIQVSGAQAVPDVQDGLGRHGVGVRWSGGRSTYVLIFDPNSYAYLGAAYGNTGGPIGNGASTVPAVPVQPSQTVIQRAIVNAVGQTS
jgi:hypothetical protein